MKQLVFIEVCSEPCVYVFDRLGNKVIILTYVDDLHIAAKTSQAIPSEGGAEALQAS
jgi:hypothetical protein